MAVLQLATCNLATNSFGHAMLPVLATATSNSYMQQGEVALQCTQCLVADSLPVKSAANVMCVPINFVFCKHILI